MRRIDLADERNDNFRFGGASRDSFLAGKQRENVAPGRLR